MNRLTITLTENGEIGTICADSPLEIYFVCPHVPHDRVYLYGAANIGPEFVREQIGGYSVGHWGDGTFGEFTDPHKPPSVPGLRLVSDNGTPRRGSELLREAIAIALTVDDPERRS